ncbi:DUF3450 domain-containing protein [Catenovulum sp. 2E275]|uniref:DUF3450 domain-containing protein n=1 Tax=Catenovulum sp. 2E275 TaxID=2980497 RepID=UPI0021D26CD4|nr:DUF3450 domain-containing protein [Catenovulum sp. 2E275]MCU4676528.1 DUF3450 domain-containing protein [Catenovulum sp. 2E275]
MTSKQFNPIYRNLAAVLVLTSASFNGLANQTVTSQIDDLTEKWLQIEQQERNLVLNWQQQKPSLEQRVKLLQAEKAQLEAILAQSTQNQDDVENKRNELLEQQNKLEAEQNQLADALSGLQAKLDSKYQALPEPVKTLWDAEQAQLDDQAQASAQLQVLIAKLSRLAQFNDQLTINETLMSAPDGKDVMVKQLYLGAGMSWFTNSTGQYRGYGKVKEAQWVWQFDDSIDPEPILKAIAIYEKRETPSFVKLPIQLSASGVKEQN